MDVEQHAPGALAAEVSTADYMVNTHTLRMTHARTATAADDIELHQMTRLPHGARAQGSVLASRLTELIGLTTALLRRTEVPEFMALGLSPGTTQLPIRCSNRLWSVPPQSQTTAKALVRDTATQMTLPSIVLRRFNMMQHIPEETIQKAHDLPKEQMISARALTLQEPHWITARRARPSNH